MLANETAAPLLPIMASPSGIHTCARITKKRRFVASPPSGKTPELHDHLLARTNHKRRKHSNHTHTHTHTHLMKAIHGQAHLRPGRVGQHGRRARIERRAHAVPCGRVHIPRGKGWGLRGKHHSWGSGRARARATEVWCARWVCVGWSLCGRQRQKGGRGLRCEGKGFPRELV